MARVFILGAGASRFAEYPLSLDLWAFTRDSDAYESMAKERARFVTEAMDRILQVVPPAQYDRPNLEELFTLLDLAELGTEPLLLQKVDWRQLRPKVMGMISWALLWHEYQFQKRLRTESYAAAPVLEKWTGFLRSNDTIVTFNWDILHEAALWRAGKWHYADGYGFRCSDAQTDKRSPTKILKLHGSVNWAQRDESDCEPAIEHKADFFHGARDGHSIYLKGAGQWNEGRNLIIPSYLKDVSANGLLLRLWNQALDALATASEVIVAGFQLHPADALARHLLSSALVRNASLSEIVVVAPPDSVDYWDSFCHNIGKTRKRVRMKFEEWVIGL